MSHPDIIMTPETYDHYLLTRARELSQLNDLHSMRLWLAAHGDPVSEDQGHVVYGYILGRLQATTAELVRWLERIPEADRG